MSNDLGLCTSCGLAIGEDDATLMGEGKWAHDDCEPARARYITELEELVSLWMEVPCNIGSPQFKAAVDATYRAGLA